MKVLTKLVDGQASIALGGGYVVSIIPDSPAASRDAKGKGEVTTAALVDVAVVLIDEVADTEEFVDVRTLGLEEYGHTYNDATARFAGGEEVGHIIAAVTRLAVAKRKRDDLARVRSALSSSSCSKTRAVRASLDRLARDAGVEADPEA